MKELDWIFEEEEFDNNPPFKVGDIIYQNTHTHTHTHTQHTHTHTHTQVNKNLKVYNIMKYGNGWAFKSKGTIWYIYDEKNMKVLHMDKF